MSVRSGSNRYLVNIRSSLKMVPWCAMVCHGVPCNVSALNPNPDTNTVTLRRLRRACVRLFGRIDSIGEFRMVRDNLEMFRDLIWVLRSMRRWYPDQHLPSWPSGPAGQTTCHRPPLGPWGPWPWTWLDVAFTQYQNGGNKGNHGNPTCSC